MKKWKENPESYLHNAEKVWYDKVKSKRTGEFYQLRTSLRGNLYLQIGNHLILMGRANQ